jgi:hypothetical protein
MPLKMIFGTVPNIGTRGKSWNDHVREDLDAVGHASDWWKRCKNREKWKSKIQVLLDMPSP